MNIIQATPSIYATRFSPSLRVMTRTEQKAVEPTLGVVVTLGCKHASLETYNKDGCIESISTNVDGLESNVAEKAANQDKNTRLSASIEASSAYAYAISLLYVNVAVNSEGMAKKFSKVATGIQPVSPVPSLIATSNDA